MIITVNNGDTIYSLAKKAGVPVSKIIADNGLTSDILAVGQSLITELPKESFYTAENTTVSALSERYQISEKQLYRNNYFLMGRNEVNANSFIVTKYKHAPDVSKIIGGYAYDFISTERLMAVINYLTYIMPFTYGFDENGNLFPPNDEYILNTSKQTGTRALLHISTLGKDGYFDSNLPSIVFASRDAKEKLTDNLINETILKDYDGVDIDFEFLPESEKQNYTDFISNLSQRLHGIGKILIVAVPPRNSDEQRSILIDAIDYSALGESADYIMLMTYEYGYKFGPARAVAPIDELTRVIEYAAGKIPSQKLILGISNYGYDWTLPFVKGESDAPSISTVEAVNLAIRNGAQINFDEKSMAPYFFYTDNEGRQHEVWFEDARSFKAKLDLIEKYNLAGGFIWDLMRDNPQGYVTINSYTKII